MNKLPLLVWVLLLSIQNFMAMAQQQSDYITLPSENKGEIIYQGYCTFTDLSEIPDFNWSEAVAAYEPDPGAIDVLRESLSNYQFIVFLGTWCEDSHRMLPEFFKVLEQAEYPLEQVQLQAVDREKKAKDNAEQEYEVHFVPTILVFRDGVLLGRITETVAESVEQDLANMLQ